jgi:dynactin complex subunit
VSSASASSSSSSWLDGKNDGSVAGHRYFTVKPKHGIFCKMALLQKLEQSGPKPTESKRSSSKDKPTASGSAAERYKRRTPTSSLVRPAHDSATVI